MRETERENVIESDINCKIDRDTQREKASE